MHLATFKKRLFKQRRFKQLIVLAVTFSLLMGVVIVPIEQHAEHRRISTLSDGMWWSVQTLTTVGYGDVTPVTDLGRLLGVLMQLVGALLFGALIALVSTSMSRGQEEFNWSRLFEHIDRLEGKIDELEKRTAYLIKEKTDHSR